MSRDLFDRIAQNPFYVLGVSPTAARADIEREGTRLLGMLQLGLRDAKVYRSPLGEHPRTEESVREALAELREPRRRLLHELLAALPITVPLPAAPPAAVPPPATRWADAPMVYGVGPRREEP